VGVTTRAGAQPAAEPPPAATAPTGTPPSAPTGNAPTAPPANAPTARGDAPAASAAPAGTAPAAAALPLAESLRGPARADYAAARILYEDGDYAGALTKLESAYVASRDPRLLWNMAACEKALRHYARVIVLLEQYLSEGSAWIGEDERQATHELVETVRGFVNEVRLDVQPAGVDVLVDGVKLVTAPLAKPLWLDMGKRRLRFEKPGFVAQDMDVELTGGKSVELKVQLQPEVHEGTLRIVSDASAVISVDGHVVGTGSWVGTLKSGPHRVQISAVGKRPHDSEVLIKDRDTSSVHASLIDDRPPPGAYAKDTSSPLWWIVGGVAAVSAAGIGSYLLFHPGEEPADPTGGTLGSFEL
jgi:hypothetical protein